MIQRRVRRARIGEIASAVNFCTVDEGLPIPDNVSRRFGRADKPMKDKSMLWMAAFGVAMFLFFACPPVRRRTVRAARACWSQIRAKLPHGATNRTQAERTPNRPKS